MENVSREDEKMNTKANHMSNSNPEKVKVSSIFPTLYPLPLVALIPFGEAHLAVNSCVFYIKLTNMP